MLKPASLRAALTAAVPYLQANPDALHVFIEQGNIVSTMAGGLSCEYAYTLNAVVTDYVGHADQLFVPTLAWLRRQQPEMLLNVDLMRDGFTFEVDFLGHDKCDISIRLKLTERVRVAQSLAAAPTPEGLHGPATHAVITHLEEPPLDPLDAVEHWTLFVGGEKLAEWDTPPFPGPVAPDP